MEELQGGIPSYSRRGLFSIFMRDAHIHEYWLNQGQWEKKKKDGFSQWVVNLIKKIP